MYNTKLLEILMISRRLTEGYGFACLDHGLASARIDARLCQIDS